ncbi:MAG: thrombospondin type 3 repeat-containing protein [Pseudomonadota bacterium]
MPSHLRRLSKILLLLASTLLIHSSTASAAERGPLWAPSHRYGPTVLNAVEEKWDGYDSYDGYFWMYQGFKWTEQELNNFKKDPKLAAGDHRAVYEFRRIEDWNQTEGSPLSDRWDGAWGRDEENCFLFIFCTNFQSVYTEYVTSLPNHDNKGLEEDDAWFSQRHALTIGPPAWSFDWCDVVEKMGTGTDCDEEYEVGFNPNDLVPNRHYFIALKFRTDREDGTEPTKWRSEFEVFKPGSLLGIVPYYSTTYACVFDIGEWTIDLTGSNSKQTPYDLQQIYDGERCYFDYDSDGNFDENDNCPHTYNPDQKDTDGDGRGDPCDNDPAVHIDDIDADTVVGASDNCPEVPNPTQEDTDGDGLGNACDSDDDDDGVPDVQDAFPLNAGEWIDTDNDGKGDNTDDDDDNDGYTDVIELNAGTDPLNKFSVPPDNDGDFIPDGVDGDDDNDGTLDNQDAFPFDAAEQLDTDNDGQGNNADLDDDGDLYTDSVEIQLGSDPLDPNSKPADHDGDLIPDYLDPDDDNDGVPDEQDAFPKDPVESVDTDKDGIGDVQDTDDDDDGYSDAVEISEGTNHLDPNSKPSDHDGDFIPDSTDPDDDNDGVPDVSDAFPFNPSESMDTDGDKIGNNADTDDDNDCYSDAVENSLGSNPLNPSSKPADNDGDCNPNALDPDDDNDGVPDVNDAFPFDPVESVDTDNDGIGNNADADDDGDGMPDIWEIQYGLNPLNANDAALDSDEDGDSNLAEFINGTNPKDYCSPAQINLCYDFYGDGDLGQCGGATGIHCVPLDEWTPAMLIQTDSRMGGCWQRFELQSQCNVDLVFCVDFEGDSPGADLGQCGNHGVRCAAVNQWTEAIRFDMDGRNGWCTQKFNIIGQDHYTLFSDFWASEGQDSNGQCKMVGTSKAYSEYGTPTATIGLDTDDRPGGCWQRFMLKQGTWSVQAF